MPRLKMLRGPERGLEIPLDDDVITIGRGRKNDIIIQDNEVSREHCRLVRVLDDYEIQDRNSTNGTYVNGQNVDENGWMLSGHMIVELGDSITFEYIASDIESQTSIPVPDALSPDKSQTPCLVVMQATQTEPEIYVLDRVTIAVGRDVDNDIVLHEPEVSRHHMRLVLTKEGYQIEDLNAMNGTFVNERKLRKPRLLVPSDHITIGERVKMWYTDDPDRMVQRIQQGAPAPSMDTADSVTQTIESRADLLEEKETDEVPNLQKVGHGLKPNALENYVFMVHAREDWESVAGRLFDYLDKRMIPIWTEQYLPLDSDDWEQAYEQALAETKYLLAVISDNALEYDHVLKALRHFRSKSDRQMIMLQVGEVSQMPMTVDKVPPVVYDPDAPEKSFRLILAELRKLYGQQGN